MENGRKVFFFDLGKKVKILDMAMKMIKVSGLAIDNDISIEITGLLLGKKLYEKLLANTENSLPA